MSEIIVHTLQSFAVHILVVYSLTSVDTIYKYNNKWQ